MAHVFLHFLKDFPVLWALIFVTDPNNKIKLSRMRNLITVIAFLPVFSMRECAVNQAVMKQAIGTWPFI